MKAKFTAGGRFSRYFSPSDYYGLYFALMNATGKNHELSENVASWACFAALGETWEIPLEEGRDLVIEIVDED